MQHSAHFQTSFPYIIYSRAIWESEGDKDATGHRRRGRHNTEKAKSEKYAAAISDTQHFSLFAL